MWPCKYKDGCGKKIKLGEAFFLWHTTGHVPQRQHVEHGEPTANPTTKKAAKTTKKKVTKIQKED